MNKNIIKLLQADPMGLLFEIKKIFVDYVRKNISTNYTYFSCFLKRIKLRKGIRFFGIPIIDRKPLSTITIGEKCTFRSDRTSNLAQNKKTIIRTYYPNATIKIGKYTGANSVIIAAAEKIEIGERVLMGFNCYITDTDNHAIDPKQRHTGKPETSPVCIGDNVWLGANVVVLKGVTIGKNSVIGANSLVLSNIPENVIAIGNPCRVVKKI